MWQHHITSSSSKRNQAAPYIKQHQTTSSSTRLHQATPDDINNHGYHEHLAMLAGATENKLNLAVGLAKSYFHDGLK